MSLVGLQLGRYTLGNLLGSGGMGEVYQAEDTHIRRKVALKIVRHELAAYPNRESQQEAERLFRREIRAIANLDHPYILPLYDYGEETINESIYAYMVMPIRPEGSLAQWLRLENDTGRRLQQEEIATLVHQAARALSYAHRRQIVHQDVKPSNFLIRIDEETPQLPDIQLADFGIARLSNATASHSQTSRGTPSYMAPEQWSGQAVPATDQYALACMSYQLLTGDPPFRGRQEQIMYQHFHTMPQAVRTLRTDIPAEVDNVLLHALAKKPEERFPDILTFATELQQALRVPNTNLAASSERVVQPPLLSSPSGILLPGSARAASEQPVLRATLAISDAEAASGTTRTLTLPGGNRTSVKVPAGVSEGQIIRLEKQGDMQSELHVTIAIKHPAEEQQMHSQVAQRTMQSISPSTERVMPRHVKQPMIPDFTQWKKRKFLFPALAVLILFVIVSSSVFYFSSFNYLQRQALLQTGGQNPYGDHTGILVLNDPLRDNSNGYFWYVGNDQDGNCQFIAGVYRVQTNSIKNWYGCGTNPVFHNFTYEVQMRINRGQYGGILFGENLIKDTYYYLRIGISGSYDLSAYQGYANRNILFTSADQSATQSAAIHIGTGLTNLVAVSMLNGIITIYANHQQIIQVKDNSIGQGQIGVAAEGDGQATEVDVSNAKVWE